MPAARADWDVVIVGGGLAGLSLAVRLAEHPTLDLRVLLLEARAAYHDDRIWCRFDLEPHPFTSAVVQSWSRLEVGHGARRCRFEVPHPYQRLSAATLYDDALRRIATSGRVELRRPVHVHRIDGAARAVVVVADEGEFSAAHVIDTRPPIGAEARLWQRFEGWVVRVPERRFDPTRALLMDFVEPDPCGVHFIYMLPFDECTALVEDTWFVDAAASVPPADAQIRGWLERQLGVRDFELRSTERGCLPMGLRPSPSPPARVHRFGVGAGDLRAATGYAYTAIQRRAEALANALVQAVADHSPTLESARAFPRRVEWMDGLFLAALGATPERGPDWFLRLFERVAPDRLQRFLHDGGTASDAAAVITALPAGPFVGAAWARAA